MSEKRKIIGVTVGTPISPSKIREKFSPFIRQQSKTDEINRPIYNLKIGKEYKAEAEQTLPHSLAVGLLGDAGVEWRYIFSEESAKDFTIKVIGAEDTTIFYEYCGELRSYDYSPYLTSAHTLEGVQLVWGGDLYLCNPDGIKDGKTPYIKDGNWWIGDTDTGVKAEGVDGVGILKIEKTATNENVDSYTITFTNGTSFAFTVTNGTDGEDGDDGVGISSIVKTSSSGLDDTYTITLTDKKTVTFTVTNGKDGTNVTVSSVSESSEDGGSNVVTFSDGKTLTVKNGKQGEDGKTPYIKNETWWIGDTDTGIKAKGTDGKGGTSVTVSSVSESTVSGGSNVVTFSDGKTMTVKNGKDGKDGNDYKLTDADKNEIAKASSRFDPTAYRLPILHLTGSTVGMTKENAVTLGYECKDKDGVSYTGSCTLKWQGSSSLAWDKKNYTVKFDKAFEVVDGWTAQKKYCLKANWIDHTHSRNVVSAKLWGLVRKNRSNLNSRLKSLPNAGAIDGFPCIIMLNGEFHGLYSFNIPKDAWMFGMGDSATEAIVGADNQAEDTAFKAETLLNADGWELEYAPDEDNAEWVKDSLNNLIRACINSNGSDLDTTIAQYLDWESAIDYYIFAVILQGGDMITKNTILATFDGVKWYFSAYDMDTTYGLEFNGSKLNRAVTTSHTTFETIAEINRVFELIKRFKTNELKARYKALRADALSESRICNYFENYAWDISSPILMEEVKKWTSVRGSAVNGIDQICRWVRQRLEVTDKWLEALPEQETPAEPEAPMVNLVPTSTDTDGSIYNGVGYKDNTRLSSSGGVSSSAQDNTITVGFMPWQSCGIIRIKGATLPTVDDGKHYYIHFYKEDKTLYYGGEALAYRDESGAFSVADITYDEASGVTTIDLSKFTEGTSIGAAIVNAKYFRLNAIGKGADLIVTVNQEIE